jgi:hypothetical protein
MYVIRTLSNDYLLMKHCIQGQSPVDHHPTMCLRICHQAVLSGLPKSSMTGFLHSPSAGSPIHKNTAIRIESFCRTMEPYGLPTETCIGATLWFLQQALRVFSRSSTGLMLAGTRITGSTARLYTHLNMMESGAMLGYPSF